MTLGQWAAVLAVAVFAVVVLAAWIIRAVYRDLVEAIRSANLWGK